MNGVISMDLLRIKIACIYVLCSIISWCILEKKVENTSKYFEYWVVAILWINIPMVYLVIKFIQFLGF